VSDDGPAPSTLTAALNLSNFHLQRKFPKIALVLLEGKPFLDLPRDLN
jgi:hypothetical protein